MKGVAFTKGKGLIIASYFGNICKLRIKTSWAETVLNILFRSFSGNDATIHGINDRWKNAQVCMTKILKKINFYIGINYW